MSTVPGVYVVVEMRSRVAAVAARIIAVSNDLTVNSIMIAALATVIRRHVDRAVSALLLVHNNRGQNPLGQFVGLSVGNGLLVLPAEGKELATSAREVQYNCVVAYARARYDSVRWREELSGLAAKGLSTDLSYYFNDVRLERDSWSGLEDFRDELNQRTRPGTSIEVVERRAMGDATMFANLHDSDHDCWMTVVCDESRISSDRAIGILGELEELLVTEARRFRSQ
jgi:hypothetical protein